MRYMLDTNILVYVLNGRPHHQIVLDRFDQEDPRQLCVSSITLAELQFGVAKSTKREATSNKLQRAIDTLNVAPFDARAAESYGRLRADLEKAGTLIGSLDMLIAGHALSLNLTLVTNNKREFNRIKGLRVDNWMPD